MPEAQHAGTQGAETAGGWTQRRLALIDKKYSSGLTAEEGAELAALQARMDEHLDAVAPVPLEQLDAFEEEVRKIYPDYGRAEGEEPGAP